MQKWVKRVDIEPTGLFQGDVCLAPHNGPNFTLRVKKIVKWVIFLGGVKRIKYILVLWGASVECAVLLRSKAFSSDSFLSGAQSCYEPLRPRSTRAIADHSFANISSSIFVAVRKPRRNISAVNAQTNPNGSERAPSKSLPTETVYKPQTMVPVIKANTPAKNANASRSKIVAGTLSNDIASHNRVFNRPRGPLNTF